MDDARARHRATMPAGSERFLETRSLAADHRHLAALLRPGLRVLDVGCGSGAITRGIADAVGPDGEVRGIDVNPALIAAARAGADGGTAGNGAAARANLRFEVADLAGFDGGGFDVVTAARVLQWLADPSVAVAAMTAAARPGGHVVVLDYDHTAARWDPPLPPAAARFYERFLLWRSEAGMDNAIATRLPQLLARAGLTDVAVHDAHERARAGAPGADAGLALWPSVVETRGHQVVADGFLSERERADAEREWWAWTRERGARQTLALATVVGTKPPR